MLADVAARRTSASDGGNSTKVNGVEALYDANEEKRSEEMIRFHEALPK